MDSNDFAKRLEALAALDDPVRRKLYLYVAGRGDDVSREDAARAAKVSRSLAAFHLDKLVDAGLLTASFRRLGPGGPGAGRPPKLYRRSMVQVDVSLPPRRYELAARVMTRALAGAGTGQAARALHTAARETGKQLASEVAARASRGRAITRAARALADCGYEPQELPGGELALRNCPFDSLKNESRDVVCGMNLALVEGLIEGLGLDVTARLEPRPGMCCVALKEGSEE